MGHLNRDVERAPVERAHELAEGLPVPHEPFVQHGAEDMRLFALEWGA